MLPIGCPPAIPGRARPPLPAAAAPAEARPVRRTKARTAPTRRVTVTVEPAESVHPMRLGLGMLIDTFA
jgi:hypothetical protein